MARVTVEDCIMQVPNRFELVLFAAQRARDAVPSDETKRMLEAYVEYYEDHFKRKVITGVKNADALRFVLKDKLISSMQKHADIDKHEEVNEMAELEQELAAALAQGGAEAAQPKALPMAEEDDITE